MTFADRARAAQHGRKGGSCTAGLLLEGLPPDYLSEVEVALADPSIYASVIAEMLEEDGYMIASETLNRHRRRRCACS